MTEEQIVIKVMEKAEKNGWKDAPKVDSFKCNVVGVDWACESVSLEELIFDHDFAKAFWGEEIHHGHGFNNETTNWQYHLQQMVLEEEPLKYLEKFL